MEKEKSCFLIVTKEIETSSSRAITTTKYVIYHKISNYEAAISRGHKHGCLVKLIDSFLVITASCGDLLIKAPFGTKNKVQFVLAENEFFSDVCRDSSQSSRSGWGLFQFFNSNPLKNLNLFKSPPKKSIFLFKYGIPQRNMTFQGRTSSPLKEIFRKIFEFSDLIGHRYITPRGLCLTSPSSEG